MLYQEQYQEKTCSPQQAISEYVCSGDIIYGGGASVAVTALNELFAQIHDGSLTNIELAMNGPCNRGLELDKYNFSRAQFRFPAMFLNPPDRYLMSKNLCSFFPLQFGMYNRYIDAIDPDVSVIITSPPDEDGNLCVGPYGFVPYPLSKSKRIIAQVSKHIPHINGTSHKLPIEKCDAIIEADDQMAVLDVDREATEQEKKIASHILEHIPDGACIQLGIGGIANAVGYGLRNKRHLGIHSEVLTESIITLMEKGAVDNSMKTFYPGVTVIGFVLGTEKQNKVIADNKDFLFARFDEVVNIHNIAANDNMISINAAIAVDLTGQVCAESIGHRQYSGTGGQLDFVRGASMSKGGCSFIALPSTVNTKDGEKSRIVFDMEPGSIITTPRTDVQYVVTEYGCVNLMFCDVDERVRRMISIAHPDYRDELRYQAKKAGMII